MASKIAPVILSGQYLCLFTASGLESSYCPFHILSKSRLPNSGLVGLMTMQLREHGAQTTADSQKQQEQDS